MAVGDSVQVGWAALGAGFGMVLRPIEWLILESLRFVTTRRNLRSTVELLAPRLQEIRRWDDELNRPTEESQRLLEDLQRSERLVTEHLEIPWWRFCWLPCYQLQLQEAYDNLLRNLNIFIPTQTARDAREILLTVRNNDRTQFIDPCKVPEIHDITVGLERSFHELKKQVLESGGDSVLVLTGLAGSGKTTLTSKLCTDDQVRGKFGENIIFVTVSKNPDFQFIVGTIFRHSRLDVPVLINDEHAIIQLKGLLMEIGKSPMMMVLDDVWHGSESLIEAFQVNLPVYKILVTSRVEFPRFGPAACQLKQLGPKDSITLFRHFAIINDRKSYNLSDDLVEQVAKSCWGSPLALKLIGKSLGGQPKEVWEKMHTILSNGGSIVVSNNDLLSFLAKYLNDLLEGKPVIKECFMDLRLFPEDRKIPVAALIDIWTELHKLDDGDIDSMNNVHELTRRHLVNLVATREVVSDVDNYYNHHFLMQHDLPREIAIHQAREEPYEERKRLIFDINENNWPLQNQQQAVARTLSISTGQLNSSKKMSVYCGA
ncbi:hypothetical protein Lal_00013738 [Lupinus albus]|nr:hypothetical protein Lal_00013738 [Lupinus albus]